MELVQICPAPPQQAAAATRPVSPDSAAGDSPGNFRAALDAAASSRPRDVGTATTDSSSADEDHRPTSDEKEVDEEHADSSDLIIPTVVLGFVLPADRTPGGGAVACSGDTAAPVSPVGASSPGRSAVNAAPAGASLALSGLAAQSRLGPEDAPVAADLKPGDRSGMRAEEQTPAVAVAPGRAAPAAVASERSAGVEVAQAVSAVDAGTGSSKRDGIGPARGAPAPLSSHPAPGIEIAARRPAEMGASFGTFDWLAHYERVKSDAQPALNRDRVEVPGMAAAGTSTAGAVADQGGAVAAEPGGVASHAAGGDELLGQLAAHLGRVSLSDRSSVKIQLKPASLGSVDMSVSLKEGVLTLNIRTELAHTRDMIQAALPELKHALNLRGMDASQISLSLSSPDSAGGQPESSSWHADQRGGGEAMAARPGLRADGRAQPQSTSWPAAEGRSNDHLVDYTV